MKTPYLDEMINELDGYIGSSDNFLSKKGNEKLTELKAIKEQLLLYSVSNRRELLFAYEKSFESENLSDADIYQTIDSFLSK